MFYPQNCYNWKIKQLRCWNFYFFKDVYRFYSKLLTYMFSDILSISNVVEWHQKKHMFRKSILQHKPPPITHTHTHTNTHTHTLLINMFNKIFCSQFEPFIDKYRWIIQRLRANDKTCRRLSVNQLENHNLI